MCFSAEGWSLYDNYVHEYGAGIDIKAFWELYLDRDEKYRIRRPVSEIPKIPKGMDFNFTSPRTDQERQIKELIDHYNASVVMESEQEMFKQAKRVADAERKLAVKETKAALNDLRVGGNKVKQMKRWIADAQRTTLEPERDNRIWPDWYLPVLLGSHAELMAHSGERRLCFAFELFTVPIDVLVDPVPYEGLGEEG